MLIMIRLFLLTSIGWSHYDAYYPGYDQYWMEIADHFPSSTATAVGSDWHSHDCAGDQPCESCPGTRRFYWVLPMVLPYELRYSLSVQVNEIGSQKMGTSLAIIGHFCFNHCDYFEYSQLS